MTTEVLQQVSEMINPLLFSSHLILNGEAAHACTHMEIEAISIHLSQIHIKISSDIWADNQLN